MIDWKFIERLEGGIVLHGYVPDPAQSQSGVTIGAGVDLGHMGEGVFKTLSPDLQSKVLPYLGKIQAEAVNFLHAHPLTVTQDEAEALTKAAKESTVKWLAQKFNTASGKDWDKMPPAFQTVVASVTFQYGTPWVRTPNFWSSVIQFDVAGMISKLRNFHDHYPTRRNQEADYLEHARNFTL